MLLVKKKKNALMTTEHIGGQVSGNSWRLNTSVLRLYLSTKQNGVVSFPIVILTPLCYLMRFLAIFTL